MVSADELSVIKTIAKVTGTDVVFYQSEADMTGRYKGANGFMRNGTMYLDVNAGANMTTEESAVLLTTAHELTHYLRENNAEGYAQLRDFVTRHLIDDGVDIEKLAEQKAARENGLLSMDEAVEEVIADSCEMMLRDTKLPEIMAKEKPGLYKQIREWIANFAEKLRKAFTGVEARHEEARAMMQYAEEMQQIWDNALAGAVRNAEAATETGSENVKYSYRGTRDDGIEVYETSAETRALSDSEKKKKYIQMMREQYRGRTAKFEHNGEIDYARFTDTDIRKDMYGDRRSDVRGQKAKLNVAADGDIFTLVENASYSGSEAEQGKDTRVHRNVISWDYYVKTVQIDGRMYDVLANIRKTADDSYVYSIQMNTRKTKEAALPRKAQSPEGKSFQKRARATSTESIAQGNEESNPKFSMRERDEDLQKKYPRLNLNEDISELDSVPAIELTDGSILPIKDRERYRTHVSFIEGNRIDVDDLRSGGWIGNGVYDASFTSDTARYIERQQAKKRVAELRGVPYDQFGDGNTRYSMRDTAYTTAVESGNTEDAQQLVDEAAEEARAMMQYAEEMQQIWDNALAGAVRNAEAATDNGTAAANNGTAAPNNGTTNVSKNAKYSLREFEDGTKYVDVKTDQDAFNGLTQEEMTSKAREIIKSRFAGKVVGSSNRAFVNNASANEYAYPSRFIKDEQVKEAKMRAAPELDNLIEAGRNYRTAADGRDGHVHKNAPGGFTYFDVTFKVGDEYFDGVINIENNKNGRRFKDITKIRNATEDIISSYGKTPKSKFLSDTSMVSISRGNENGNTKFSMRERDDAADVKTAEKYFGTTYKIAEAGYLLRDGKLLDMSGRHEGAPGGYRTVDHRDITDAFDGDYGDGSYSGGMVQFMQAGNIRLSPESGGINLSTKPNAKQLDVLDRYISSFRGEVTLDIDNANGDTVVSIEYPKRTYSKRIINDINEYFDNGTVPAQPSDLGQFRYSMRDVAADDTADERRGRQESYAELRRQNEELRRRAEYWKGQTRTTKEATVRQTDTDAFAWRATPERTSRDMNGRRITTANHAA